MKKAILILLILIPITSALGFSPTTIQLELEENELSCKEINFKVESLTKVTDKWAQNPSQEWSLKNFETPAKEHKIEISYPEQIYPEQNKIDLCAQGSKAGDYKGAIIFRQEPTGGSIIQFAIWVQLSIKPDKRDKEKEEREVSDSEKKINGKTSGIIWTNQQSMRDIEEQEKPEIQNINFNEKEKIELSKPKIKEPSPPNIRTVVLFISSVLLAVIFGILIRQ